MSDNRSSSSSTSITSYLDVTKYGEVPQLSKLVRTVATPSFNNYKDAEIVFLRFIEANATQVTTESRVYFMKFVNVLPSLYRKNLRWLQFFYAVMTTTDDTPEAMVVTLQQQFASTPDWKRREEFSSTNFNSSNWKDNKKGNFQKGFPVLPIKKE